MVLFHWRQNTQIALHPSCIVIMDIVSDHLDKVPLTGEPSAVIAFPFQNAPEALHRAIINAVGNAGHTLRHSGLYKFVVEGTVGILKSSVAVKQGMCVRIGLNRLVEGFENQRIVVALTKHIGHDAPVTEIQNGTQIEFVYLSSLIPLEFCYIGKPLLVGLCSIELPIQKILSKILRILCLPGTSAVVVFHGRVYISGSADAEYPLIINVNAMVMAQVVIESTVAFIWAFLVNLFNLVRKTFILRSSPAQFSGSPFVVS